MTKNLYEKSAAKRSLSDTRLIFCRSVMLAAFAGLALALVLFQVLRSDRYVGLALQNRLRLVRMPPVRGRIFDRNGLPLAMNVMTFDIMGYPLDLQNDETRDRLVRALARAHLPSSRKALDKRIKKLFWAPYRALSVVPNLTMLQMTELLEDTEFPQELFPLPVWRRIYPAGPLVSHVLGYVGEISASELKSVASDDGKSYIGGDIIGKSGIENFYEPRLRGREGERAVEVDARGRPRRTLHERGAEIGEDLTLTLDLRAQGYAAGLLEDRRGVMIALDVHSGEVLVMCSTPSYDPNPLAWGVSSAEWRALNFDKTRPMLNRAISGQYSPGSIFKAVTGYAALESGKVTKGFSVFCPGYYRLGRHVYRCWRRGGHGSETIVKALRDSCDVFFYETSQKVGIDKYDEVSARFGLGQVTGIDLPGELPGLLPGPKWKKKTLHESWYKGDSVNMSIGQGYLLMTPLQMASVFATIANGGRYYRPKVLKDRPVSFIDAGLKNEYLSVIREGLNAVTRPGGTGWRAKTGDFQMAGKTGTVQNSHGADHAVFAGYAPFKNPRFAVVCFLEGGESGGRIAAPLVGKMLEYLLEHGVDGDSAE